MDGWKLNQDKGNTKLNKNDIPASSRLSYTAGLSDGNCVYVPFCRFDLGLRELFLLVIVVTGGIILSKSLFVNEREWPAMK